MDKNGILIRIYINENAHHGNKLMYKSVIEASREHGLAGATVFRGICGYQAGHEIHDSSLLRLSDDLPLLIEIVDTEERVNAFLPVLEGIIDDGLITLERVSVFKMVNKKRV